MGCERCRKKESIQITRSNAKAFKQPRFENDKTRTVSERESVNKAEEIFEAMRRLFARSDCRWVDVRRRSQRKVNQSIPSLAVTNQKNVSNTLLLIK